MNTRRDFLKQFGVLGAGMAMPSLLWASNASLTQRVQAYIDECRRTGRLGSDERTAWVVYDLRAGKTILNINPSRPMQCASMVKPLVIQAYLYCHYRKDKKLYPLDERVKREMRAMIVDSNNEFTNFIMKRLGGPQGVQWMLRKQAPKIFQNISIVEYIPKGGKTYKNKASAGDYTRFLQALWKDQLPGSQYLKSLMKIKNHDRIAVRTNVPSNAVVYDKTGSTAQCCGDFGVIALPYRGGYYPYTFTGIIDKPRSASNYTNWINTRSNVMRGVSNIVYSYFDRLI